MPRSSDKVCQGRPKDAHAIPKEKEIVRKLTTALTTGCVDVGNDAFRELLALTTKEAEKSVSRETGSAKDSRVDEVADDAATSRIMALHALVETVNASDAEIEDPEKLAKWYVRTTLDDVRGFSRKDGHKVPARVWRPSARNRHQQHRSLDDHIAGPSADDCTETFADVCEDTKADQPWQVSSLREEETLWQEIAASHVNRSVREILPILLELCVGDESDICPLKLYDVRPIKPPRVDQGLLQHMGEAFENENTGVLELRVRNIREILGRFDLIEPSGLAIELESRARELLAYADNADDSECSSKQRESLRIVADYLLRCLSQEEFQRENAANVALPSLLLEYECRVNREVIDHLQGCSGRSRDTLQKSLKRIKDILLSDPSTVMRRTNPREHNEPEA